MEQQEQEQEEQEEEELQAWNRNPSPWNEKKPMRIRRNTISIGEKKKRRLTFHG